MVMDPHRDSSPVEPVEIDYALKSYPLKGIVEQIVIDLKRSSPETINPIRFREVYLGVDGHRCWQVRCGALMFFVHLTCGD